MVLGVGAPVLPQRTWRMQHKSMQAGLGLSCRARPFPQRRVATAAAWKSDPKYNKYRDRQTVEKEYYREWERTAALTEGGVQQPQTARSTLLALPPLIKYYLVPDPLRYIWFFIWQALLSVARRVQRLLILQGCKLESTLLQRAGRPGGVQRRLALLRWHGRIPLAEGAKYWANLLQGKVSEPQVLPAEEGAYGPNYMPGPTPLEVLPQLQLPA